MRMKSPILTLLFLACAGVTAVGARESLVPLSWTEEGRTSQSEPLQYTSPDGTASLTLHATPAAHRSPVKVTAREGERITYQRVTPRFVAVSGFKGDRIFYRKSNLACGGTRWHHIALEYDARDKRKLDAMVTRIAHGMNRYDSDCKGSGSETSGGLAGTR